jgi:hypothetical protein
MIEVWRCIVWCLISGCAASLLTYYAGPNRGEEDARERRVRRAELRAVWRAAVERWRSL